MDDFYLRQRVSIESTEENEAFVRFHSASPCRMTGSAPLFSHPLIIMLDPILLAMSLNAFSPVNRGIMNHKLQLTVGLYLGIIRGVAIVSLQGKCSSNSPPNRPPISKLKVKQIFEFLQAYYRARYLICELRAALGISQSGSTTKTTTRWIMKTGWLSVSCIFRHLVFPGTYRARISNAQARRFENIKWRMVHEALS